MKQNSKKMAKVALSSVLALALVISSLCLPAFAQAPSSVESTFLSDDNYVTIFEDDFNRADGDINGDNGWYSVWTGSPDNPSHKIENNALNLHDYSNGGGNSFAQRPLDEGAINQRVSVDILNLPSLAKYQAATVYLRNNRLGPGGSYSDSGYYVIVSGEYMAIRYKNQSWGDINLKVGGETVNYTLYYDHSYRVVFTASGSFPTRLAATLYDMTAGVAVATCSGMDSTEILQYAAPAGLASMAASNEGMASPIYDNFKYEVLCENGKFVDDFNREDGAIGNGWVTGPFSGVSIESGAAKIMTNHPLYNFDPLVSGAAVVRPLKEASVNQVITAEFQSAGGYAPNQGGALIARCQGTTAADDNCYKFYIRAGFDNPNSTNAYYSFSNSTDEIRCGVVDFYSNSKYRLKLSVIKTGENTSTINIALWLIDNNGNIIEEKINETFTDNDPKLQSAGTAGFSMFNYYDASVLVDNFTYEKDPAFEGFEDDFNRADGAIGNGWSIGSCYQHSISSNALNITDDACWVYNYQPVVTGAAMVRPLSEASLNQVVSADFYCLSNDDEHFPGGSGNFASQGGALIARCQGATATDNNCYYVSVENAKNGWNNDAQSFAYPGTRVIICNTKGVIYNTDVNLAWKDWFDISANARYRMIFSVFSVDSTHTSLNIRIGTVDENGNNFAECLNETVIDDDAALQSAGTVGVSILDKWGATLGIDNFSYKAYKTDNYSDDFNRLDGSIGNGWSIGSCYQHTISSNALSITDDACWVYNYQPVVTGAAMVRPLSEASLNQNVSADFYCLSNDDAAFPGRTGKFANQGGALIARCQGTTAGANCYYVSLENGRDGYQAWCSDHYASRLLIANSQEVIYNSDTDLGWQLNIPTDARYRMKLSAISVDSYTTLITVSIHSVDAQGNEGDRLFSVSLPDSDPALQSAGAAGVSIVDRWGASVGVDNFSCEKVEDIAMPNAFSIFELESDNVYKNNYVRAYDADAFSSNAVKVYGASASTSEQDIATVLNSKSGYIAYPVYTDFAGNYPIKLRYRFGADNQSDFDSFVAQNGNVYATAVVNGVKYNFANKCAFGQYALSDEVNVALNEGVNIIYLMAPVAEIANAISGAYIDYDCLLTAGELTPVSGTFALGGDVNTDGNINILDLVREKRFMAGEDVTIDRFAADLAEEEMTCIIDSEDLIALRQLILKAGTDDAAVKAASWLKFCGDDIVNPISLAKSKVGGANAQANAKLNNILNAEDTLEVTGTKYYVSENGDDSADGTTPATAWKTLAKVNSASLSSGDGVFFERGSTFRQAADAANGIVAVSGVTYGAYGEGAKPKILGSAQNYANAQWEEYYGNIYYIEGINEDVGNITFDNGSSFGIKKLDFSDLQSGNEFFYDSEYKTLYLFCSFGCPSDVYNSIEIGTVRDLFLIKKDVSNVTIDNLDLRYTGAHGISAATGNNHIVITNCALSFIGGSLQGGNVRYGNAIQFWNSANGVTVDNCLVEQVYDAGLTFQGPDNSSFENIFFTNNLIRNCNYSVEFFVGAGNGAQTPGLMSNIGIENNIMQFAGCGMCAQRPSKIDSSHICGWMTDLSDANIKDFRIKNNIFDLSEFNIVNWKWNPTLAMTISGNSYFMESATSMTAMNYGNGDAIGASSQDSLEAAVSVFDSAPAAVTWLGK